MTESDQKREDDVLRRMLATKLKPHKSLTKASRSGSSHTGYEDVEHATGVGRRGKRED